jgi:hypothetical protein
MRTDRFKADCQGLVTALKDQLAAAEKEKAARTDAERAEVEAERRRQEADEAARIAAEEERARAQSIGGLSPEEARKAEELANWDLITGRGQPQDLRDHIARFPDGITAVYALTGLETPALQAFLDEFSRGANSGEARAKLAELERVQAKAKEAEELKRRETDAWAAASGADTLIASRAFLKDWSSSKSLHVQAAQTRLKELKSAPSRLVGFAAVGAAVGVAALFAFLHIFPKEIPITFKSTNFGTFGDWYFTRKEQQQGSKSWISFVATSSTEQLGLTVQKDCDPERQLIKIRANNEDYFEMPTETNYKRPDISIKTGNVYKAITYDDSSYENSFRDNMRNDTVNGDLFYLLKQGTFLRINYRNKQHVSRTASFALSGIGTILDKISCDP